MSLNSLQTSDMYNNVERKQESDESLDSETEKKITNQQIEEARYEHLIVRKHIDQARAKIDREIAELDRAIEVESNPRKHDTEEIKGYAVHPKRVSSKEEFESFEKQGDVEDISDRRIWYERLSPSLKNDSAANQHLREAFENSHIDSNNNYHNERKDERFLRKYPISQSRDHFNSRYGNEEDTQRPVSPTSLEVYGVSGKPRKMNRYCPRKSFENEDEYHVRRMNFHQTGKNTAVSSEAENAYKIDDDTYAATSKQVWDDMHESENFKPLDNRRIKDRHHSDHQDTIQHNEFDVDHHDTFQNDYDDEVHEEYPNEKQNHHEEHAHNYPTEETHIDDFDNRDGSNISHGRETIEIDRFNDGDDYHDGTNNQQEDDDQHYQDTDFHEENGDEFHDDKVVEEHYEEYNHEDEDGDHDGRVADHGCAEEENDHGQVEEQHEEYNDEDEDVDHDDREANDDKCAEEEKDHGHVEEHYEEYNDENENVDHDEDYEQDHNNDYGDDYDDDYDGDDYDYDYE